jgi:hypothetical protein
MRLGLTILIIILPYPKLLSSEKLKENKQYLRRESLLKAYDNKHGTYIQPSI